MRLPRQLTGLPTKLRQNKTQAQRNAVRESTTRKARAAYLPPGSCTAGSLETATKRSIVDNANPGIAPPPCASSVEMGQCSAARTPPRAVRPSRSRDQEAARSNRRESLIPVPVTPQWCAQEAADHKLRVHHGLLVANMVEDHHEGVLHAACSR